jgi:hypothetical protein
MRILLACIARSSIALALLCACDRNLEPFDPAEQPRQPDLSKIFPEGSEEAPIDAQAPLEPPPAPRRDAAAAVAQNGAPIHGTLRVASDLAGSLPSGAVLFVIARSGAGGPPLAVKRIESPRFPLEFEIGEGDRMIKSMPFAGPVLLTARLDSDGNAMSRTPGDLQGAAREAVSPGASGVEIVLDQRL